MEAWNNQVSYIIGVVIMVIATTVAAFCKDKYE